MRKCPICNEEVIGTPQKVFCSKGCATKSSRRKLQEKVSKELSRTCPVCEKEVNGSLKKVFCSERCRSSSYANKRSNDPEEKEKVREFSKKRREVIQKIKLESGCIICGYNTCAAALHFNHRNPEEKSFGISQDPKRSWKAITNEIAKCEILCANCHAELTHREGHHKIRKTKKERGKELE